MLSKGNSLMQIDERFEPNNFFLISYFFLLSLLAEVGYNQSNLWS